MKSRGKSLFTKNGPQGPGRGPAKGTGGRPPDEFMAFLRSLRDDPAFRKRLQLVTATADDQTFMKFAGWLTDRTDGKALQQIQADGLVTVRVIYDDA